MKTFDKINIIIANIGILMVLWHVFAPDYLCFDNFFGWPTFICMFFVGLAAGAEIEENK